MLALKLEAFRNIVLTVAAVKFPGFELNDLWVAPLAVAFAACFKFTSLSAGPVPRPHLPVQPCSDALDSGLAAAAFKGSKSQMHAFVIS